MTKQNLIVTGIVLILLAVGYDTVTQFRHASDNKHRIEQVCDLGIKLAHINRERARREGAQTQAILAKGVTFGIPKQELPKLLKENDLNTKQVQREYDEVANTNCKSLKKEGKPHARNVRQETHRK